MAKDRQKELIRLQQALLEEEAPETEAPDVLDTDFYRDAPKAVRAYNTDRTDVDLEDFSRQVYEPEQKRHGCLTGVLVLLGLLVAGWILLKMEGIL